MTRNQTTMNSFLISTIINIWLSWSSYSNVSVAVVISNIIEVPQCWYIVLSNMYVCIKHGAGLTQLSIFNTMTSSNGNIIRVTGHLYEEFTGHRWIPLQRPVTRSFDAFFYLRLNNRLSKWWGWWSDTPSCPLWRQFNNYRNIILGMSGARHACLST